MEVILLENIINLGNIGDKVIVKPGYGRNFLLKTGKALRYSKENLDYVSKKKSELNKKNLELKNKLKEIAKTINNKSFEFSKESKENGELYGSIKPKEISNKILEKLKVEVKPSQILIKENLDKIGNYNVDINLHSEVSAKIIIKIVPPTAQMKAPDTRPYCQSPNHKIGIPMDNVINNGKNSISTKTDSIRLVPKPSIILLNLIVSSCTLWLAPSIVRALS